MWRSLSNNWIAGRIISVVLYNGVVITAGHDGHIRVHSSTSCLSNSHYSRSLIWFTRVHIKSITHRSANLLYWVWLVFLHVLCTLGLVQVNSADEGWSSSYTRRLKAACFSINKQLPLQWWGWQGLCPSIIFPFEKVDVFVQASVWTSIFVENPKLSVWWCIAVCAYLGCRDFGSYWTSGASAC